MERSFPRQDRLWKTAQAGPARVGHAGLFDATAEAYVAQRTSGFRVPYKLVEDYLGFLEAEGALRSYRKNWMVAETLQRRWEDRRRRRWELDNQERIIRLSLNGILAVLPADERIDFAVDRWWAGPQASIGISFKAAFEEDDRRLSGLSLALYQIEAMLRRKGPIVIELLGLPLERQRERIIEARRMKAEQERVAGADLARTEALDRVRQLEGVRDKRFRHNHASPEI